MGWLNTYRGKPPRQLTERDVNAMYEAAIKRPKPIRNREQIRQIMCDKNPWRWRRLQSDMRWLRRQMKRAGFDPEDARWLV